MSQLPRPTSEPIVVQARGSVLGRVQMWALSDTEVAGARSASLRLARSAGPSGSGAFAEAYARQMEARLVASAARVVGDVRTPALPSAEDVMAEFTEDEVRTLFRSYGAFRASVGPVLSNLTPDTMKACIAKLAVGADSAGLDVLRWGSPDRLADVPGVDPTAGFLDCHFLCWCAARKVLYPDTGSR